MKHTNIFILIIFITFNTVCQSNNKNAKGEKEQNSKPCSTSKFTGSDTSGVYTGEVIHLNELKPTRLYRSLSLKSQNDTIFFRLFSKKTNIPTENVIVKKLKPGMCVTVYYKTDIIMIEGIEANRFYNAKRLEYPN